MAFYWARGAGACPQIPPNEVREEYRMPFKSKATAPANISHLLTGRPWKEPSSSCLFFDFFFFKDTLHFLCQSKFLKKMLDFNLNPRSELWNVHLTFSSPPWVPFLRRPGSQLGRGPGLHRASERGCCPQLKPNQLGSL